MYGTTSTVSGQNAHAHQIAADGARNTKASSSAEESFDELLAAAQAEAAEITRQKQSTADLEATRLTCVLTQTDRTQTDASPDSTHISYGRAAWYMDKAEYTLSSGTKLGVDSNGGNGYVYRFTQSSEEEISITIANGRDIHMKEVEGGVAVLNKHTGTATLYKPDGTRSPMDDLDLFADMSGDDIVVNWNQTAVDTGDGDDVVINFADNARINTGNGNDVVKTGASKNLDIDLGEGNNRLEAQNLTASTVCGGNGNNSMSMHELLDSSLTFGNGNNAITGYSVKGSAVIMGDGDNTADLYAIEDGSTFQLGNGDNHLELYEVTNNSTLRTGDGNNRVELYAVENDSTLSVGNGNNVVKLHSVADNGTITAGNGNNIIQAYNIRNNSAIHVGDGNNRLKVSEVYNSGTLTIGHGNNILRMWRVFDNSQVHLGNGNNVLSGDIKANDSGLYLGTGTNVIQHGISVGYNMNDWDEYHEGPSVNTAKGHACSVPKTGSATCIDASSFSVNNPDMKEAYNDGVDINEVFRWRYYYHHAYAQMSKEEWQQQLVK